MQFFSLFFSSSSWTLCMFPLMAINNLIVELQLLTPVSEWSEDLFRNKTIQRGLCTYLFSRKIVDSKMHGWHIATLTISSIRNGTVLHTIHPINKPGGTLQRPSRRRLAPLSPVSPVSLVSPACRGLPIADLDIRWKKLYKLKIKITPNVRITKV